MRRREFIAFVGSAALTVPKVRPQGNSKVAVSRTRDSWLTVYQAITVKQDDRPPIRLQNSNSSVPDCVWAGSNEIPSEQGKYQGSKQQ